LKEVHTRDTRSQRVVNKMKCETAPGTTGLASDLIKALTEKTLEHFTLIIHKFWKGEEDH
jgi:hypothetical protein